MEHCCPACGGIGCLLGQLGRLIWLRCQDCGINFHTHEEGE